MWVFVWSALLKTVINIRKWIFTTVKAEASYGLICVENKPKCLRSKDHVKMVKAQWSS